MGKSRQAERLGEVGTNSHGSEMIIIAYRRNNDVDIRFKNGYTTNATYDSFRRGLIRNPFDKSVYGQGHIGVGNYAPKIGGKLTLEYEIWRNMLLRCYCLARKKRDLSYRGCTVLDEWLNFQNFAKWCSANYYKVAGERMELDKDIMVKDNKIYSPETCVFVPRSINALFVKGKSKRGTLPIGVSSFRGRFVAHMNAGKKSQHIGIYDTPEEAFVAYKQYKEKVIQSVANRYKGVIPERLYSAMMAYNVEMCD